MHFISKFKSAIRRRRCGTSKAESKQCRGSVRKCMSKQNADDDGEEEANPSQKGKSVREHLKRDSSRCVRLVCLPFDWTRNNNLGNVATGTCKLHPLTCIGKVIGGRGTRGSIDVWSILCCQREALKSKIFSTRGKSYPDVVKHKTMRFPKIITFMSFPGLHVSKRKVNEKLKTWRCICV